MTNLTEGIFNKVLIIDDDDLSIFLIGFTLQKIPYIKSYESVTSGWEALKFLEESKGQGPDLILVDLNMPEMDGFEFMERYDKKFAAEYPETKLIVVTSSQRESDKTRSLSFRSVKGFVQKPLTEEKLRGVLSDQ